MLYFTMWSQFLLARRSPCLIKIRCYKFSLILDPTPVYKLYFSSYSFCLRAQIKTLSPISTSLSTAIFHHYSALSLFIILLAILNSPSICALFLPHYLGVVQFYLGLTPLASAPPNKHRKSFKPCYFRLAALPINPRAQHWCLLTLWIEDLYGISPYQLTRANAIHSIFGER